MVLDTQYSGVLNTRLLVCYVTRVGQAEDVLFNFYRCAL